MFGCVWPFKVKPVLATSWIWFSLNMSLVVDLSWFHSDISRILSFALGGLHWGLVAALIGICRVD